MRQRARLFAWGAAAALALAAAGAAAYAHSRHNDAQRKAALLTGGDPTLAPALLRAYGCTSCHHVPGVQAPGGLVGQPLRGLKQRLYVGGVLTHTPENLVRWIVNPKAFSPNTAMQVTGISEPEARHVAAYLYARE